MTEITLAVGQVWYDPTFQDIFKITEVHHDVGFGELSSDQGKLSHFDRMFLNENMQLLQREEQGQHWSAKLKTLLESAFEDGPSPDWQDEVNGQVLGLGSVQVRVTKNHDCEPSVYVYQNNKHVVGVSGSELLWAIQQVAEQTAAGNEMVSIPKKRMSDMIPLGEVIAEHMEDPEFSSEYNKQAKKDKKRAKKAKKKD